MLIDFIVSDSSSFVLNSDDPVYINLTYDETPEIRTFCQQLGSGIHNAYYRNDDAIDILFNMNYFIGG
jgi:hypothetical protein